MSRSIQKIVFAISILIHLSYYISAYFTHTFDIFFDHVTMGQDFFQIPNAAFAFLHGGTLTGSLPPNIIPYTDCCGVNSNVYHPLFTLIVGIPLQLFSPWTAFGLWGSIHFLLTMATVLFLWKKFSNHRYLYLALSLLLLNSYQYYEIQHAQYHFLFIFFTLFFVYTSVKKGDSIKAGILLFLNLLVKPIGLLWILPLILYKHFKIVTIGLLLFLAVSIPFYTLGFGKYYFLNLYSVSASSTPSYNLLNFVWLFPQHQIVIEKIVKFLMYTTLLFFLYLQIYKKPSLFTLFFLWTSFQLLFYGLVFHYHFAILGLLFCLGILFNDLRLKKRELIPIIFLTIPSPFFLYNIHISSSIGLLLNEALCGLWSDFWLIFLIGAISIRILKEKANHA